ncbi:MAG: site-specific integrase, partial [Clostridia bacterium]|nr:site-specific integrase [Clostridia bacterium]
LLMFLVMEKFSDILCRRCDYEKEVKNHNSWKYRYHLIHCFGKWLAATKGRFVIEEVELADIINYLVSYKTTPIKTKCNQKGKFPSRNAEYNVLCSIRTFFKFCCIIGLKLKFNWEQIPLFKQDEAKREPMSEADYGLLHAAIRQFSKTKEIRLRDELMIEIPRETGLRRTEITRLRFSDFHNANRQCRVLVKGNRYEAVFYSERLQKKVLQYEQLLNEKYKYLDIEYLFICLGQKDKGKIMTNDLLGHNFRKLVKKMVKHGLIPPTKRLTLHMERHSFAMRCVYSGLSQQATTQLMRHKDPKITLHYYHMNDTWLLNQYDLIK